MKTTYYLPNYEHKLGHSQVIWEQKLCFVHLCHFRPSAALYNYLVCGYVLKYC